MRLAVGPADRKPYLVNAPSPTRHREPFGGVPSRRVEDGPRGGDQGLGTFGQALERQVET
ncbi:hypothetical protein C4J65_34950 [Streptomyces sp. CB09001]|nr:hypothetical protein C4J65_34950 [Streptomyces sp. CB09001]